jgi:hypothetical protein
MSRELLRRLGPLKPLLHKWGLDAGDWMVLDSLAFDDWPANRKAIDSSEVKELSIKPKLGADGLTLSTVDADYGPVTPDRINGLTPRVVTTLFRFTSAKRLSYRSGMHISTFTRHLKGLEKRGAIIRIPESKNRRCKMHRYINPDLLTELAAALPAHERDWEKEHGAKGIDFEGFGAQSVDDYEISDAEKGYLSNERMTFHTTQKRS